MLQNQNLLNQNQFNGPNGNAYGPNAYQQYEVPNPNSLGPGPHQYLDPDGMSDSMSLSGYGYTGPGQGNNNFQNRYQGPGQHFGPGPIGPSNSYCPGGPNNYVLHEGPQHSMGWSGGPQ